jgi:hypothetical protein
MQIQCVSFPGVNVSTDTISSCGDASFDNIAISTLVSDNPQWFIDTDSNNNQQLCTIILPTTGDISASFTSQQGPYTITGNSFVGGRPIIIR